MTSISRTCYGAAIGLDCTSECALGMHIVHTLKCLSPVVGVCHHGLCRFCSTGILAASDLDLDKLQRARNTRAAARLVSLQQLPAEGVTAFAVQQPSIPSERVVRP